MDFNKLKAKIDQIHNEGWHELPPIDRDRYDEIPGLEGPYQTRAGKVIYYDPIQGEYYDRDSDMYLSYDDYAALDKLPDGEKPRSLKPNADAQAYMDQMDAAHSQIYDSYDKDAVDKEINKAGVKGKEAKLIHSLLKGRRKKVSPDTIRKTMDVKRSQDKLKLGETDLTDKDDYKAKRKALQDIQMDPATSKDPDLKVELMRRKASLEKEAEAKGFKENVELGDSLLSDYDSILVR